MSLRSAVWALALVGLSMATNAPVATPLAGAQPAALSAAGSSVTVQQAVRTGCYSDTQLRAVFDVAKFPSGSVTERKIKSYFYEQGSFPDRGVTKARVNALTWVYRGYKDKTTDNWHVQKLLAGVLYSKAQNRVDQGKMDWSLNGPQLSPGDFEGRNPAVLAMRLLAIQTSDTPPSQFISVALDYEVAKTFGQVVYAFQVRPDSELLGLRNCRLGGGEDQLQIAGGTPISNLHRRVRGESWTRYDQATKQWVPITGTFPPN